MVVGIIDQQALSLYQDDLKEVLDEITESEKSESNIRFLQSRLQTLETQTQELSKRRGKIKEELKNIISKYRGELVTVDQMLKYMLKEQGACEIKIKELKGEL